MKSRRNVSQSMISHRSRKDVLVDASTLPMTSSVKKGAFISFAYFEFSGKMILGDSVVGEALTTLRRKTIPIAKLFEGIDILIWLPVCISSREKGNENGQC